MRRIEQMKDEKRCKGPCGLVFPRTNEFFHKAPTNKDGLNGLCAKCDNAKARARWKSKSAYEDVSKTCWMNGSDELFC